MVCVHHLFHMTRRHIFWKIVIAYHQNYQKGCTRLAAASDKVYQLLAHGRWFSLGTLASSTTKIGRHDIAEILLKVALNTKNQIKYTLYDPPRVLRTLSLAAASRVHPFW
jgi:hypothetical protein